MTTTLLGTQTFNTTSGTHTVVATPAVGDLIVIVRGNTGNTTSHAPTDNNADGLGTYSLVKNALYASSANLMEVWVRNSLIGSATSTTFTDAAGTTTGGGLAVLKITGATTPGSLAIRQSQAQANQASGTTPTPVFSSAALTTSTIIGAVMNVTTPATVTQRTGYTELLDVGYSSPVTGLEVMIRDTGETGTSIAWGSTSASAFCSIVLEVIDQTPPTVALNTPADTATGVSTTPTLNFTGTDANSDTIEYEAQVDTVNTFDSTAGQAVNTYYFNGSGGITDSFNAWANDANAFDGSTSTIATSTSTTNSSQAMTGVNTNAPTSGSTITQVRIRIYGNFVSGTGTVFAYVKDGATALTGTASTSATGFSAYQVVTPPVGGWTWAKINALTGAIYGSWASGVIGVARIEIEVTSNGPLLDKFSAADAGFTAGHPFTSGVATDFTVQAGDTLASGTTYYWRVRGTDPTGSDTYGAWSGTRSFTTLSGGGGTLYTQTLSEAVTTTDTLSNQAGRILSEATSLTVSLLKQTGRTFSEATTLATFFIRGNILSEAVTHSDTLLKLPGKVFTEVTSLTDTLSKVTGRILSESTTLSDTILKQTGRIFTEATSLVDSLIKGRIFFEAITTTDAIIKLTGKVLSEATSITDTLLKQAGRTFSEATTITDVLIKNPGRIFSEAASLGDTLAKQTGRLFSEATILTGTLIKTPGKFLLEAVANTDTLTASKVTQKTLSEAVALADSVIKTIGRNLSEAITHTDSILKQTGKIFSEATSLTDKLIKITGRSLSEAVSFLDSFNSSTGNIAKQLLLTEAVSYADTINRTIGRLLNENFTNSDTLLKQSGRIFSEVFRLSDGRYNLVLNPSFEDDAVGTFAPSGWGGPGNNPGTGATTSGVVNDAAEIGSHSYKFSCPGGDGDVAMGMAGIIPLLANVNYVISGYIKTNLSQGQGHIHIGLNRANGSQFDWSSNNNNPGQVHGVSDWTRVSFSLNPGTEFVSLSVNLAAGAWAGRFQGDIWFDGLMVEQADSLGSYFDGDYLGQWTGIQADSASLLSYFSFSLGRIFTDSITATDILVKTTGRTLLDAITFTDSILKKAGKVFIEAVVTTDILLRLVGRTFNEAITSTDTFIRNLSRILLEAITHTDTLIRFRFITRLFSETVSLTDIFSQFKRKALLFIESLSFIDMIALNLNGQDWYIKLRKVFFTELSKSWFSKLNKNWQKGDHQP